MYTKDFSSKYQKPINGDAKAYYAYLPAIFIYQDATYQFVDDYEKKYYAKDHRKDFVNATENGRKVNKTFPGVAILYLPFFLIAHFLASIGGLEADGYSLVYQYLFDFGYWFYILLGAIYYVKTFRLLKFKESHIYFSLLLLVVGTNVLFYSMVDQSVTHLFNFAMINGLLYQLLRFKSNNKTRPIYYSIALLLLIGITRPTNVLVLLLIPIFIPHKQFYLDYFSKVFRLKSSVVISAIVIGIGSVPFVLWQWQTGNWVVYGYGDEGFDFGNPEWSNFLFSYVKGWFTYTPITLVSLCVGLFYMFKRSVTISMTIIGFYALSVFIFSSWWCWYYGAGMGQRVMIDHFILMGYLVLVFLQDAPSFWRKIVSGIFVILIVINCIQTYQIATGIYPLGSPSKVVYWDNFLSTTKKVKVYEKANWKLKESIAVSLQPNADFIVKGESKEVDAKYVLPVNEWNTYSPTFQVNFKETAKAIVLSMKARANTLIEHSRLVITCGGGSPEQRVIYLNSHVKNGNTVELEYLIELETPTYNMEVYVWNGGSSEELECFDVAVESYVK